MARVHERDAINAATIQLFKEGLDPGVIAARVGISRPGVVKKLKRAGFAPPTKKKGGGGPARQNGGRPRLHDPDEPLPIPDRTPCPRCNVRSDIGCRHQPSNGLTSWVLR